MRRVSRSERPARPGGLRQTAASGARWTSTSAAFRGLMGLVQVALLSRFLEPADFGLAATATVVLGGIGLFSDLGLNNSIIARRTREPHILASLYWANMSAALALSLLAVIAAPGIAAAFGESELTALVRVAAAGLFVAALGQQFQIVLARDLEFRRIAEIEVAAQLVSFATAVGAAVSDAGAYAIVLGLIAGATTKAILLIAVSSDRSCLRPRLSRRDLDGYVSFGAFQLGERLVNYVAANLDYLLIGLVLGPKVLGLYFIAYQLVVKPLLLINPPLTRVAFPIFAQRSDDDAALRRGFLEVTRLICFIVGPLIAAMAASAAVLVPVLFGDEFRGSIVLVQILAPLGVTKALSHPLGSVLLAKQRPDIGFKIGVANLVILAVSLGIGVTFGVVGVAIALLIAGVVLNAAWPFLLDHVLGLRPITYLQALGRPLTLSLVIGCAVYAALIASAAIPVTSDVVRLALCILAGLIAGAVTLGLRDRDYVREVALLITR